MGKGTKKSAKSGSAEPNFDELINRLRTVVERLEGGNLSLGESLEAYEEGVKVARQGHQILDEADKRVELLSKVGDNGEVTTVLEHDEE